MKLHYGLPGRGTTVFILWMVPICAPFSFSSVSRAENIEDMQAILVLFCAIHRIAPECENCSAALLHGSQVVSISETLRR